MNNLAPPPSLRKTLLAGLIGNAIEFYDFIVYAYLASYFAIHFCTCAMFTVRVDFRLLIKTTRNRNRNFHKNASYFLLLFNHVNVPAAGDKAAAIVFIATIGIS
jgi:hypothetical protein